MIVHMEQWMLDLVRGTCKLCLVFAILCFFQFLWYLRHEFVIKKRPLNNFIMLMILMFISQTGDFFNFALSPFLFTQTFGYVKDHNLYTDSEKAVSTIMYNIFVAVRLFSLTNYIYLRATAIIVGKPKWHANLLKWSIRLIAFLLFYSIIISTIQFMKVPEGLEWAVRPFYPFMITAGLIIILDLYFLILFVSTLKSSKISKSSRQLTIICRYGIRTIIAAWMSFFLSIINQLFETYSTLIVVMSFFMWIVISILMMMKIAVDREAETKVVAVKETTLSGFSSSSDTHNTKSVQQNYNIVKD